MTAKINCWEFKQCGREPGGEKVKELGVCPAAIAKGLDGVHGGICGGRACWSIAGTFRNGKPQGTFAYNHACCSHCEFFRLVVTEEELPGFLYSLKPLEPSWPTVDRRVKS